MTVLGIETSSSICSAGLANDRGISAVRSLDAGSIHSEKLLTLVKSLLEEEALSLSALDAIAVSSGPGSFTGLRIGFSAAKGLCLSSGKPLAVVSTFEALAVSASYGLRTAGNILVALDAKKGDFYAGTFEFSGTGVSQNGGIRLLSRDDLAELVRSLPGAMVISDAEREIRSLPGGKDVEFEDARKHFRGDVIAARGLHLVLKGEVADMASAEPLYLKDFVIPGRPSAA